MNLKVVGILSLVIVLLGLNSGCEKDPEFLPGLKGSMVGYLYSFDQYGTLLEDHSGFKITALGHVDSYHAQSDENGRFELKNLPTGTYELHIEKSGFGTLKQFGVQHLGGRATILLLDNEMTKNFFLYENSETQIQHLLIEDNLLTAAFLFSEEILPRSASMILYFSTEDGFDIQAAQYTIETALGEWEGSYSVNLYFRNHPFRFGETVYYRAGTFTRPWEWNQQGMYLYEFYGPDRYFDYESNQIILPNLGEISEQYSFLFQE